MTISILPHSAGGRQVTAVLLAVMAAGGPGCATLQLYNLSPVDAKNPIGLLINTDTSGDVLGAVRLIDGREAFAFGRHTPDGSVDEITDVVFRDAEGNESSVSLEGGLLKKAASADGSTLDITYDEVSSVRLKGRVTIFIAALEETREIPFDVDLQQAIADLAQQAKDLTGITVSTRPPPTDPIDPAARTLPSDATIPMNASKSAAPASAIVVFAPHFQFAFASVGFLALRVMVEVIGVMMRVLVGTIVALTRAMIVAIMTPFIMLAELMRAAAVLATVTLNFRLDLNPLIVVIPRRPHH